MPSCDPRLILGIDPGSLRTGFGLVECCGQHISHVAHGTIVLDSHKLFSERLADLARDLIHLLEKYKPKEAIVEDVFVFKNPRSALILGQARGAVLGILGLHSISVQTLTPNKVKALITGRGRAQKFQVAQIVALELGIEVPISQDSSDALALALAHARTRNFIEG